MANQHRGPLYQSIAQDIASRISSGEFSTGDQLPSERELCSTFSVSRITIRHAIRDLESRGLVDRVHGVGTFVAAERVQQALDEVQSFNVTLARLGRTATTRIAHTETVTADFGFSKILGVKVGAPLRYMQLVGFSDEEAVVVYESWFDHDLGMKVEECARRFEQDQSGFSSLDIHRSLHPNSRFRLEQSFEATGANPAIAKLLSAEPKTPLMRVETIVHNATGPLEYRIAYYRGDKYTFAMERIVD